MNIEITKSLVEDVIKYISTIPEEDFIKKEQTLNFDPRYIGKKHCVIGWIDVALQSPFKSEELRGNETTAYAGIGNDLHRLCNEKLGIVLAYANNNPESMDCSSSKEASIKLLQNLITKL